MGNNIELACCCCQLKIGGGSSSKRSSVKKSNEKSYLLNQQQNITTAQMVDHFNPNPTVDVSQFQQGGNFFPPNANNNNNNFNRGNTGSTQYTNTGTPLGGRPVQQNDHRYSNSYQYNNQIPTQFRRQESNDLRRPPPSFHQFPPIHEQQPIQQINSNNIGPRQPSIHSIGGSSNITGITGHTTNTFASPNMMHQIPSENDETRRSTVIDPFSNDDEDEDDEDLDSDLTNSQPVSKRNSTNSIPNASDIIADPNGILNLNKDNITILNNNNKQQTNNDEENVNVNNNNIAKSGMFSDDNEEDLNSSDVEEDDDNEDNVLSATDFDEEEKLLHDNSSAKGAQSSENEQINPRQSSVRKPISLRTGQGQHKTVVPNLSSNNDTGDSTDDGINRQDSLVGKNTAISDDKLNELEEEMREQFELLKEMQHRSQSQTHVMMKQNSQNQFPMNSNLLQNMDDSGQQETTDFQDDTEYSDDNEMEQMKQKMKELAMQNNFG